MHPRTAAISSALVYVYGTVKRVSLASFTKEMKRVLTAKEAEEVFEYMTSVKPCLAHSTERIFTWTCKEDHFNSTAVDEMIIAIGLTEERPSAKKSSATSVKICKEKTDLKDMSDDELAAFGKRCDDAFEEAKRIKEEALRNKNLYNMEIQRRVSEHKKRIALKDANNSILKILSEKGLTLEDFVRSISTGS